MSKSSNEHDALPLSPAEQAYLREGFARLLPTPELESAVQEIAASAPAAPSPWKGRLGLVATLAVAAAVLFALYVPKQNGSTPAGPGEPTEANSNDLVVCAPSKEEVDAARSTNPRPKPELQAGTPPRWHHTGRTTDGGSAMMAIDELLPPFPKMHHRWVVREDDKQFAKPDEFDFGMPPKDGVMLLGAGILNKLGGLASFDGKDGALVVKTRNGEWRALPKSATAELEISSPEEGGATARIRVGISIAYEGSLVVEGPLARALGLHHFEHPRRALLGSELRWPATQSYARIRIPSVQFDETMLVQVRETLGQTKGVMPSPPDTRISVRGVIPARIAHADQVRFTREDELEVQDQDAGMTLGIRATAGPDGLEASTVRIKRRRPMDVALVYDADTPGLSDSYVFAGRFDAHPDHSIGPGFLTKWCEVRLPKAPGARVTIARVWRGDVAIPSREGVTITWADKRGRVRCPRIVGEAPAPLRMRVEPKRGKPFFQMLNVDGRSGTVNFDGPRAYLTISSSGRVIMGGTAPGAQLAPSSGEETLLGWFRKRTSAVPRTDTGISQLEVHVTADNQAPLSTWLQILSAASHPDVKVRRFKLSVMSSRAQRRDAGRTVTYALPSDRGLSRTPRDGDLAPLRLALGRRDPHPIVQMRGSIWELGGTAAEETTQVESLRSAAAAHMRSGQHRMDVVLMTEGGEFPMRAIALILEALDGLKLDSIGFELVR